MKKVRIGILGLGNMGTSHAEKLFAGACEEIVLTAVCDRKKDRCRWARGKFGDSVAVFESAEPMMDSGLIDAAVIAVPHYDHPKYAIMAMKKGLHCVVEKPAGVYTKQVLEMNKVADECNVVFAIMMNQRTNCIYRKMREIVQSGKLGQIRRTHWLITNWYRPQTYYDSGDWRATWSGEGGGVLLNQCPHNLDLMQWICGMPAKVSAKMQFGKWHDIEVEDEVSAYLEYPNGATGVFVTSTGDACGTNRFEIILDKGKLVAEDNKLHLWQTDQSEEEFLRTNKNPFGNRKFECSEVPTDGENAQHMGVFRAFAANILHATPLVADGREGIRGLTISNALHLSAWTGSEIDLATFAHDRFYEELKKRIATSRRKIGAQPAVCADMDDTFGV